MKVIFFDGYCGLCNGFVNFIMQVDRKSIFHFSPLQSEYAAKNLPAEFTQDLKSVVVQIEGKTFRKSRAVLRVFKELGGPWALVSLLGVFPESLLDLGYGLVAKYRYLIFGKNETCRLPTPDERARFIL